MRNLITIILLLFITEVYCQLGRQPLWTLEYAIGENYVPISGVTGRLEYSHIDSIFNPVFNVLYVSLDGDNSTARKGDSFRPFENPWSLTSVNENDVIQVDKGVFDLSSASTKAWPDNNTYVFDGLTRINIDTTGDLFSLTAGDTLILKGYPFVEYTDPNASAAFVRGVTGTYFSGEIGELKGLANNATNKTAAFIARSDFFSLHVKRFEVGRQYGIFFEAQTTGQLADVKIDELIMVDDTYSTSNILSAFETRGLSGDASVARINLDVGSYRNLDGRAVNRHFLILNEGRGYVNSQLNFRVHNWYSEKAYSPIAYTASYGSSSTRDFRLNADISNTKVDIEVDNVDGNILFGLDTSTGITDTSYVQIRIGSAKSIARIFEAYGGILDATSILHIHCDDCVVENDAAIVITGGTFSGKLIISGRWKTNKASTPVIYTNKDLILQNCTLINDGTNAPIEAPSAVTATCMGVYANSATVDADVTEGVESIVRNVAVK